MRARQVQLALKIALATAGVTPGGALPSSCRTISDGQVARARRPEDADSPGAGARELLNPNAPVGAGARRRAPRPSRAIAESSDDDGEQRPAAPRPSARW